MRLRFTIARLMGVVLFAAIGLTAWRYAGNASANIIFNLTVLVLIVATYKAKFTVGRDGAWWLGFATLGWAHLGLWVAAKPWQHLYSFNLSLITDVVYWVLAANVGISQLAENLRTRQRACQGPDSSPGVPHDVDRRPDRSLELLIRRARGGEKNPAGWLDREKGPMTAVERPGHRSSDGKSRSNRA